MTESSPKPIAFMVMPFRKRPIPDAPSGAPKEVDFDALWNNAFKPALEELGYLAVRADSESGSVIVKDMLERLAFADLVLADMTLPNGNVYYEVGIRHVAKETSCVLIAADWSKQLFDTEQMRTLRYPLTDGSVMADAAEKVKQLLLDKLTHLKDSVTPFHEFVTSKKASGIFRSEIEKIYAFQTKVCALRLVADSEDRKQQVSELVKGTNRESLSISEVAYELLTLVRDCLTWQEAIAFVDSLPDNMRNQGFVREQKLLALSKSGDHATAIAGLKELITHHGDSPERSGLLGGRYKKLWRDARNARLEQGAGEPNLVEVGYLDDAIENYRRGMHLDLNEYYCVCNLPGLLRSRRNPGDEEEAAFLDKLTVLAARIKVERGADDGWARSTLLGAAFRTGNVEDVAQLAKDVVREGPAVWQLESTLSDINDAVAMCTAPVIHQQLEGFRNQLSELLKK